MRYSVAVLGAGALLLGCGSGLMHLDAKKVSRLTVVLVDGGDTVCPTGPTPEVVAVVVYDDGRVFETRTPSNSDGKLPPRELEWTADVGTVDERGVLLLPVDLLPWHDRAFVVRARVPKRPELKAELRITPRFDCGGVAAFNGLDGYGASPGNDGEAGGRGPRLEVALAYVDTTLHGRLVLVRVRDRDLGRLGYYLVDPRAGQRLVISADGGEGGAGGYGSNGGDGASGTRGADGASGGMCENGQDGATGSAGQDGTGGRPGGRGGDGGSGGSITVVYPAAFPELAQVLSFSVAGGAGGAGGQGGQGGRGGDGGHGGNGGSAGSTATPDQACTTRAGSDGSDGAKGIDGSPGANGTTGLHGGAGVIAARPDRVRALFPFELGRGWAIVADE